RLGFLLVQERDSSFDWKFEELEAKAWEEKDDATLWSLRGLIDLCAIKVAVRLCRPRHCVLDRFKILVSANDHKVKITRNKAYTGLPKTELSWKQVIESLHIACRVGNLELLSTLISTGANINGTDSDSMIALHIATSKGKVEICDYLIQKGAIIDVLDKKGQTPLMHAVKSKEPKEKLGGICHFSLEVLKLGDLECVIVCYSGEVECLLAHSHGEVAYSLSWLQVVKMLVSADVSMINNKDEEGWTALHFAASNGCLEITKILKTYGETLEITDKDGYTPSEIAARRGKMEVYDYLVEKTVITGLKLICNIRTPVIVPATTLIVFVEARDCADPCK
ncbi:hypothetical protein HID58_007177, partial [Brassica napus]